MVPPSLLVLWLGVSDGRPAGGRATAVSNSEPPLFLRVLVPTARLSEGPGKSPSKDADTEAQRGSGTSPRLEEGLDRTLVRVVATAGLLASGPCSGEGHGDRLYTGQAFPSPGSLADGNDLQRAQHGPDT